MPLDLTPFAETLGDVSLYFVDEAGRSAPLVIEHATGDPKFVVVDDALVPYADWCAEHQRATPAIPPPDGVALEAGPGEFQFGATVTNPPEA